MLVVSVVSANVMESCVQVMDSLYQTGVKKAETDLLIDQLREVFSRLSTQYKVLTSCCLSHNPGLACRTADSRLIG